MPPFIRAAAQYFALAWALLMVPSPSPGTETPFPHPNLVHKQEAVYPREARDAGESGIVVVRVLVDSTGTVVQAFAHRRTDQAPQPRLEAAAIEAAFKSKFEAARPNGKPVASWVALPFNFAPTITLDLTASDTEFAVHDSIAVTATITSNARIDSLMAEMTFPTDPYGIHARMMEQESMSLRVIPDPSTGFAASVTRKSWVITLVPGRPVTLSGMFAARSCGSASIRVRCMPRNTANVVAERLLPVCIRGYMGSHLAEYELLAEGDSTPRALRVDDRIFAQRADACCSSPTRPSK